MSFVTWCFKGQTCWHSVVVFGHLCGRETQLPQSYALRETPSSGRHMRSKYIRRENYPSVIFKKATRSRGAYVDLWSENGGFNVGNVLCQNAVHRYATISVTFRLKRVIQETWLSRFAKNTAWVTDVPLQTLMLVQKLLRLCLKFDRRTLVRVPFVVRKRWQRTPPKSLLSVEPVWSRLHTWGGYKYQHLITQLLI